MRSAFINTSGSSMAGGAATYIGTGGGGSASTVQAVVDFGTLTPQETTASTLGVSASWVTANSVLLCQVISGQDHTADEIIAEQVSVSAGNIVPGVGFDVVMSAPNGASGKFVVNVAGF